MFPFDQFKRVVAGSGLSKTELSKVYGVSRQTIYGWLDGTPPKAGSYTERMAITITRGITAAIRTGALPMQAVAAGERKRRVRKMAATLQALKPEPVPE